MPRISRRLLTAAVMSAAIAPVMLAGSGVAGASTGPAEISPEQAGYTATGAQFKFADTLVYLRNPRQYASEVASFGDSVQLWSAGLVVILGVKASTSGPGYTQYATIYDRSTHTVIASNPNAEFCDENEDVCNLPPRPFDPGTQLGMSIEYSPADGSLRMTEVFSGGFSFVSSYTVTGQSFTQARIGTDFGGSPWDGSYSHKPPASQVKVAAYSNPTLITYSGHSSLLWSWWVHHPLLANTGQQSGSDWVAAPAGLSSFDSSFSTYFVPQSEQGPNQPAVPTVLRR
jgi:hypothetical protein